MVCQSGISSSSSSMVLRVPRLFGDQGGHGRSKKANVQKEQKLGKLSKGPPGHCQCVRADRQEEAVVMALGPDYLGSNPSFSI